MNPKVFISHASEDKERFVLDFAKNLRKNGVDAWLDKWEMQLGDSLVDKIFEEGIKEAEAIIIILSKNSVLKPWVKEELNTGLVNRISKGTKLIPIIIDDCDVPESLKSIFWQSIKDLNSYSDEFQSILASIFGLNDKPKLGEVPEFISSSVQSISGLTKLDELVLKTSCEFAFQANELSTQFRPNTLFQFRPDIGISQNEIDDSVEILSGQGYLNITRFLGGNYVYWVTGSGFYVYLKSYLNNFDEIEKKIISLIVNEEIHNNFEIQKKSNESIIIVNSILLNLDKLNLLNLSQTLSGAIFINHVSARLRRVLT